MKLLLAGAIALLPVISVAQENPKALKSPTARTFFATHACDNVMTMTDLVVGKYREQPLFKAMGLQFSAQDGKAYAGSMMMFVNQDTGTWSLITLYPDGTGCMVATGREFEPYNGPKINPSKKEYTP